VRGRFGPYEPARLTDKPLPAENEGISLPVEVLQRYVGQYEFAPGMALAVRLRGERLVAQPGGQPEAELFAETETCFFVKVVDASLEFELDDFPVILHFEGRISTCIGNRFRKNAPCSLFQ